MLSPGSTRKQLFCLGSCFEKCMDETSCRQLIYAVCSLSCRKCRLRYAPGKQL